MNKDEIKERVRALLARTLKIEPTAVSDDASQADLSQWDSVRHMNVVLAVENDFDIQFEDAELPKLTSLSLIVAAVEKHVEA